jgi:hypothetical protein
VTLTITLVADVHVSKAEAIEALSKMLSTPIDGSDPSDAVLTAGEGVVLSIEVPKFGEDLPLTIDLTGARDQVVRVASDLIEQMKTELSWSCEVVGSG